MLQVGWGVDEKNWGAGPLGTAPTGFTPPAAGPVVRAAIPTIVARVAVGPPRAAASPKA